MRQLYMLREHRRSFVVDHFHAPFTFCISILLRPIYTVRFLLAIVACDFCSPCCSRHGKIVYDFYDIKLPVATIVVGF